MDAILLIYLWGIYDNIVAVFIVIAVFLMVLIVILGVTLSSLEEGRLSEREKQRKILHKKWIKRLAIVGGILIVLNILIPPKNIAVMMYATPTAIEALQSISDSNRTQTIVDILDNSLTYLETKSRELK